jgi:hypothetical protein
VPYLSWVLSAWFSLFSSLSSSVLFVFLFFYFSIPLVCSAVLVAAISAFTLLFSDALAAKLMHEHECS